MRTTLIGLVAITTLGGCKDDDQVPSKDWRPVLEKLDQPTVRAALAGQGWTVDEETTDFTITKADMAEMGKTVAGDTVHRMIAAHKDGYRANVTLISYPARSTPPEGFRTPTPGMEMIVAGQQGFGVSVSDSEFNDDAQRSGNLLDALVAAAKK